MRVELEKSEELILLDSPTPSLPFAPAPSPANDTVSLHPYSATDIWTMTDERRAARKQAKQEEEERAARRKAKKALKKKRSKEVKKQQKMLKDSEPQKVSNWVELCDADTEASDPPPSAPSMPSAPPTPAPRSLPPTPTPPPRRTPISAPSTSSLMVSPSVTKKKIQGLRDVVVENPFARRALLGSPPSPSSPSTPPGTPLHPPRPSRSEPAPSSGKRDRSRSAPDKVLSQDDLRHGLKPHSKHPKFVKPSPPPSPTLSQSKNPSAMLVIGQCLISLLRDNLPGRMCSIREALGEQNTSAFN